MKSLLYLTFFSVAYGNDVTNDFIEVLTTSGNVVGQQVSSHVPNTDNQVSFAKFPTIPFAKPPVGDLRYLVSLIFIFSNIARGNEKPFNIFPKITKHNISDSLLLNL